MTTTTPPKNTSRTLLLAWLFATAYVIASIFSMNDFWKCYVNKIMSFFSITDPDYFCRSATKYMYMSLAALGISLLLFVLYWRRSQSRNWIMAALIAGALVLAGCYFLFKTEPAEMMFMEYVELKFYPFWLLTLASFFVAKCVAVLVRKKSS